MSARNYKRLSMLSCVLGVSLMGVDLLMTQNFFSHIGELMVASIFCFTLALLLDSKASRTKETPPASEKRS